MYSAIKIQGKKLYEYARKGQIVDVPEREIEIYDIKLTNMDNDLIYFIVSCSKGTYIRTLCEDIAIKLGTVGYMKELNRTKVGIFDIKDAVKIDDNNLIKHIISIENIFEDKEKIDINNNELKMFLNGMLLKYDLTNDIYKIYNNKKFIGLGIVKDKELKRDVVLS